MLDPRVPGTECAAAARRQLAPAASALVAVEGIRRMLLVGLLVAVLETSTRRLALGTTLAVAALGFVAGLLPGGLPS